MLVVLHVSKGEVGISKDGLDVLRWSMGGFGGSLDEMLRMIEGRE